MLACWRFVWQHFQPPWWDNKADLREMQDNMATGAGYEGTDEYTPVGADPSNVDKAARRVTVDGPAHAAIRVSTGARNASSSPRRCPRRINLALHLFNYPAWRVEVNGRQVQAGSREGTGQMLVPVEAGENRVLIVFTAYMGSHGRRVDLAARAFLTILLLRKPVSSPDRLINLPWKS
jgi:hypothetical protein